MHKTFSGVLVPDAGEHLSWNLQLFAGEGAPSGDGGDGSTTGVQSADAGQNGQMEGLGIPQDKLDQYMKAKSRRSARSASTAAPDPQPAEPAKTEPEQQPEKAEEPSELDKTLDRPDVKQRIQDIVRKRVASYDDQQQKLAPILEILGQKYDMDVSDLSKLDFAKLADAVANDSSFFEGKAEEMGSSPETAKRVFEAELSEKRKALDEQRSNMRAHFEGLQRQADEMAKKIPGFNLAEEMQNRRFTALISPHLGFSVEEAYNAVHHDEIVAQRDAMAVAEAKRATANSVMAGRSMPPENGTVARTAVDVPEKLYSQMTPDEKKIWLKEMKARGSTGRF
jgi:hypothetical protein